MENNTAVVTFHPMSVFPKEMESWSNEDGKISDVVIVYEVDKQFGFIIDSDFGYYDFDKKEWCVLGENSMKLHCWCEKPNPVNFVQNNKLKHSKHRGYRK